MKVFNVCDYYNAGRYLCHKFKDGNKEAVLQMAKEMAEIVVNEKMDADNCCLVPIPSHNGRATTTLILANEIGRLTGLEVCDYLHRLCLRSQYEEKKKGCPMQWFELEMFRISDTRKTPLFVDSVLDTGATMEAAYQAFYSGGVFKGCSLVYAKV